ncbi:MAG: hypothetical protein HYY65_05230 [Candidatus Tectomicrobia bacterium]|uniref:Uncharacterized protein n=1 Tax=Tectimicrobiota bacterium TaxID=2528274 RepID=A0A932GNY2_UNCTE|nr:hypothetical protein [Candidatus Tectomicrobia bacterium]
MFEIYSRKIAKSRLIMGFSEFFRCFRESTSPAGAGPCWENLRAIKEDTGACAASIQSMAWWGLKTLGIPEKITGYGKLLETLG